MIVLKCRVQDIIEGPFPTVGTGDTVVLMLGLAEEPALRDVSSHRVPG